MTAIMMILKNKWVMMGILAFVCFVTYEYEVHTRDIKIDKLEVQLKSAKVEVRTHKLNFKVCKKVNTDMNETVSILQDEIVRAYRLNETITKSKDNEISTLKDIMEDLQKVEVYPKTETNVTIKIKDVADDKDIIFNTISNIGS